jgi:hypothetical protein
MFDSKATNQAAPGHAPVRQFTPGLALRRRPEPALRNHANDNRAAPRPRTASVRDRQILVCRWRRDPATGRLICNWERAGDQGLASEPDQPRRAA